MKETKMPLGQVITHEMGQFFLQNVFLIVLLVTFVLFALDFYTRFFKINKDTDNVNLVERYCWLTYFRNYAKRNKEDNCGRKCTKI